MKKLEFILKPLRNTYRVWVLYGLSYMMFLGGCISDKNFEQPNLDCNSELVPNASFIDIKNLYIDETIQIQEDFFIEGYIISSDAAGNFFSTLYFQNAPINPTEGFQIEIDLRDSHLFYDLGQRVLIKLKGLYLGKSQGVFKLGGVFNSFGNLSVGRLPSNAVFEHVLLSCTPNENLVPVDIAISE